MMETLSPRRTHTTSLLVFVLLLLASSLLLHVVISSPASDEAEAERDRRFRRHTLVIMDSENVKSTHSQFFQFLTNRGYDLDYKVAYASSIQLEQYGQYKYHNVIFMAPKANKFGGSLDAKKILDFVDNGAGNVMIAASDERLGETLRQVASESGVEFDDTGNNVIDHLHYVEALDKGNKHTVIAASGFARETVILGDQLTKQTGEKHRVIYRGMGMSLDESNFLLVPILRGHPTSYSFNPNKPMGDQEPLVMGESTVLVAGLQARNGARMTFVGSMDMLSDQFFSEKNAANKLFAQELAKWSMQERGYLRARDVKHHKVNVTAEDLLPQPTTTTYESFGVTDDVVYSVVIEEWDGEQEKWVPFVANDIQLEFIMLHPYERTSLVHQGKGQYVAQFKVPDVYGVYKFVVDYRRVGYSLLTFADQVTVRPLKTHQYERFIPAAFPYYASLFSVMGAFALFCFLFLHTKDQDSEDKQD